MRINGFLSFILFVIIANYSIVLANNQSDNTKDTLEIFHLCQQSKEYYNDNEFEQALITAQKAYKLAQSKKDKSRIYYALELHLGASQALGDYSLVLQDVNIMLYNASNCVDSARALNYAAQALQLQNKNLEALAKVEQAIKLLEKDKILSYHANSLLKDIKIRQIACYVTTANHKKFAKYSYRYLNELKAAQDSAAVVQLSCILVSAQYQEANYPRVMEYVFQALQYKPSAYDKSYLLLYQSYVYLRLEQTEAALQSLKTIIYTLEPYPDVRHRGLLADTYDQLAMCYKKLKRYDQVFICSKKSIRIYQEIEEDYYIPGALNNLGEFYLTIGQKDSAEMVLLQALKQANQLNQTKEMIYANNYLLLLALKKSDLPTAIKYGHTLSFKVKLTQDYKVKTLIYSSLSWLDSTCGKFQTAYLYAQYADVYKDSMLNESIIQEISKQEARFEFEEAYAQTQAVEKLERSKNLEQYNLLLMRQYTFIGLGITAGSVFIIMLAASKLLSPALNKYLYSTFFILGFEYCLLLIELGRTVVLIDEPYLIWIINTIIALIASPLHNLIAKKYSS